jgi:hypothetical protein
MGEEDIQTVQCDQGANTCTVKVPAPSYVLVFLNDNALSEVESGPSSTFATTVTTKTHMTVDQAVLATSNGHHLSQQVLGSTSKGSLSVGVGRSDWMQSAVSLLWTIGLGWGVVWLLRKV